MSDFTIEQLEALKEGTLFAPESIQRVATTAQLLDALIAEKRAHQKLRAEIEAVLDVVKHETWLHDDEGQFPETVQLGSYVAGQLTRILEVTDE